jgi:hypothetical protein
MNSLALSRVNSEKNTQVLVIVSVSRTLLNFTPN